MTVIFCKPTGFWFVFDTAQQKVIRGPYSTNAQAWDWIDTHCTEGHELLDQYRRIGKAFSEY
jgi:hypothetical protein